MKTFLIGYSMDVSYEVKIEADTKEEALRKFHAYDYEDNSRQVGAELQEFITAEEVGE